MVQDDKNIIAAFHTHIKDITTTRRRSISKDYIIKLIENKYNT